MHMSILSGRVSEENWRPLESAYERLVKHPPKGVISSVLVQSVGEPHQWQIITIWGNVNAYRDAKDRAVTNFCYDLFCDAGTIPRRTEFSVIGRYVRV